MTWNIKEDFCGDGATYSSYEPTLYHITPSVKIQTDRKLTEDERRRVIDALVKAARDVMRLIEMTEPEKSKAR